MIKTRSRFKVITEQNHGERTIAESVYSNTAN